MNFQEKYPLKLVDLTKYCDFLCSIRGDAKILNEVQDRFDVNITELPDEIDLSSYSKCRRLSICCSKNKKYLFWYDWF